MTCATCRYMKPIVDRFGECRRYAPRAAMTDFMQLRWPVVSPETDWCGEHQPRHAATGEWLPEMEAR